MSGSTYSWASCAMNSTETYLVTPCGDLLVSRCRASTYAEHEKGNNNSNNSKDNIGSSISNHITLSRCSSFSNDPQQHTQGLLGGDSSMDVNLSTTASSNSADRRHTGDVKTSSAEEHHIEKNEKQNQHYNHEHHPTGSGSDINISLNIDDGSHNNLGTLKFMPSFDYSHNCHVHDHHEEQRNKENCNNKLQKSSSAKKRNDSSSCNNAAPFLHGIPVFFSHLSQIKITKLSAHPLGSHCLLISSEALLFSFGSSNEHGQLGTGTRRACASPTVITPILENGGKALDCAAGATHSLVIVQTDGKRVSKMLKRRNGAGNSKAMSVFSRISSNSNNAPSSVGTMTDTNISRSTIYDDSSQTPLCLHQVYAFGSNGHMKLGLVSTSVDESDNVLLPRRVALHCQVSLKPGQKPGVKYGIFSLAASMHHSAALVRRSNGSTELYTWGYAGDGALGLDARSAQVVVTPTLVRNLPPYLNTQSSYNMISKEATISTLLTSALSKSSSFSTGKRPMILVGNSRSGGLNTSHSEVLMDIVVGMCSTFLLTSEGKCLVFGKSDFGLLGLGEGTTQVMNATRIVFGESSVGREMPKIKNLSVGLHHAVAVSQTGEVWRWGSSEHGQLGPIEGTEVGNAAVGESCNGTAWEKDKPCFLWRPERLTMEQEGDSTLEGISCDADLVCAGSDATIMVMKSGEVLSCGKNSGRLGQGELDENVYEPTPMFGGVKLWQDETR